MDPAGFDAAGGSFPEETVAGRVVGAGDLGCTARHQELGMVTLGEMIHEWAGHDLMHTVQGERAILQPFIDGCGPWKRYFSDHVVPFSTTGGR